MLVSFFLQTQLARVICGNKNQKLQEHCKESSRPGREKFVAISSTRKPTRGGILQEYSGPGISALTKDHVGLLLDRRPDVHPTHRC